MLVAIGRRMRSSKVAWAAVVLLAVVARAYAWTRPHVLLGVMEYDDGVYYAAAKALAHGMVPYRDFVVVHPPLMTVLLTPFAALGSAFGDPAGMAAARVAMLGVAIANVTLVRLIALEIWGRRAAVAATVGALAYAIHPDAVIAEHTVLLEPVTNLCGLAAVLVVARGRPLTARRAAVAGALLGAGLAVKLFAAVYVLAVLAWLLAQRQARALPPLAAGAAAAVACVAAPFAVLAPHAMWSDVIASQLSRPPDPTVPVQERIADVAGFDALPDVLGVTLFALIAVLWVWMLLRWPHQSRRQGANWVLTGCLGAVVVVFVRSPSYFSHYGGIAAPLLALVLAGFVATRGASASPAGRVLTAAALVTFAVGTVQVLDRWQAQGDLGAVGAHIPAGSCVYYYEASLAIAADRLHLPSDTCPGWIDARGVALVRDPSRQQTVTFLPGEIPVDAGWQRSTAQQVHAADVLLLRDDPSAVPGWPQSLRAYVLRHFTRSWSTPHTRLHAEVWQRRPPA